MSMFGGLKRLGGSLVSLGAETSGALRVVSGWGSRVRLIADIIRMRFRRFKMPGDWNTERSVRLSGGGGLTYRMNAGDLQGIREVWMEEVYRPPFEVQVRTFVDLGGNIGLTSTWFGRRFKPSVMIAVEPDPENARLLRKNLQENGLQVKVIEAAVGPQDGEVVFQRSADSNLGSVAAEAAADGQQSIRVPMVSMESVFRSMEAGAEIDLLKLDIEGGEEALFMEDLSWLAKVRMIIAELHPPIVDCKKIIETLEAAGFTHIPSGTAFKGSMTAFVRR